MHQPSPHPDGAVVQTLQKGYALQDRILRPAQVSVSKQT
jgi:molecular chaperone GrpE